MKKLLMQKKGQSALGLNLVKVVIGALLVIGILAFVAVIAMNSLRNANIVTSSDPGYNETEAILLNVSQGISSFFGNIGTIFAVLGVVVIVLAIVLIVVVARRAGGGGGGGL